MIGFLLKSSLRSNKLSLIMLNLPLNRGMQLNIKLQATPSEGCYAIASYRMEGDVIQARSTGVATLSNDTPILDGGAGVVVENVLIWNSDAVAHTAEIWLYGGGSQFLLDSVLVAAGGSKAIRSSEMQFPDIDALEASIAELQSAGTNLQAQINANDQDIADIEQLNNDQETKIQALIDDRNFNNNRLDALEQGQTEQDDDIASLDTRITTLENSGSGSSVPTQINPSIDNSIILATPFFSGSAMKNWIINNTNFAVFGAPVAGSNGFSFDGIDDYIEVGDANGLLNHPCTVMFIGSAAASNGVVLTDYYAPSAAADTDFRVYLSGLEVFTRYQSGTDQGRHAIAQITNSATVRFDGGSRTDFVDGTKYGPYTITDKSPNGKIFIGASYYDQPTNFNALFVKELIIWNRALSDTEISNISVWDSSRYIY